MPRVHRGGARYPAALDLPDEEETRAEFLSTRLVETGPGVVKIQNPPGAHDDIVTAVGMLVVDLTEQPETGRGSITVASGRVGQRDTRTSREALRAPVRAHKPLLCKPANALRAAPRPTRGAAASSGCPAPTTTLVEPTRRDLGISISATTPRPTETGALNRTCLGRFMSHESMSGAAMSVDEPEMPDQVAPDEPKQGSRRKRAILIVVGVLLALVVIGNLLPSDEADTNTAAETTAASETTSTTSSEPAPVTTSEAEPTTTSVPAPTTTSTPPPATTTKAPTETAAPETTEPESGFDAAEMEQEFLKNIPGHQGIKDMCDPAYTHWACFYEGVEGKPAYLKVNLLTDGGITDTKELAKKAGWHWFNFIGCQYPDLSVIVVSVNGLDNNVFRKDVPLMSNC